MSIPAPILETIQARGIRISSFEDRFAKRVLKILLDLERDILGTLRSIDPTGVSNPTWRQARLGRLLVQTRASIDAAYKDLGIESGMALERAADSQLQYENRLLQRYLRPLESLASVNTVAVSPDLLRQLVQNTAVSMGDAVGAAPISRWLTAHSTDLQTRFALQMGRSVQLGESIAEMTRRLVGDSELSGLFEGSRRAAETLARTSVQSIVSEARRTVYRANRDTVKGIGQTTTDDDRTTLICLAYASKTWIIDDRGEYAPVDHDLPYAGGVPRHPQCRSVEWPWVSSLEEMGIDPARVPPRLRQIFDGKPPKTPTGAEILGRHNREFQDKLLGATRGRLWRTGRLSLEDMISDRGGLLRVADLT